MPVCYHKRQNLTALASMIWVFTGRTSYCPKSVFQISMFPVPPASFIPSLSAASDLSLVCIGLSQYFGSILIPASFICISDEKLLNNLTNKSVSFPSERFLPRFLVTLCYEHAVSSWGKRECDCCIFCIFTYIFFGNKTVPELRVIARWRIWAVSWKSKVRQ